MHPAALKGRFTVWSVNRPFRAEWHMACFPRPIGLG